MNNLLKAEDLIDLHEELNDFAKHHHKMGGQQAHKLITKVFISDVKNQVPKDSLLWKAQNQQHELTIKLVLALLAETFDY